MRLCLFFVCLSQMFAQKEVQSYDLRCDIDISTFRRIDVRKSYVEIVDQLTFKVIPRCKEKFTIEEYGSSDWKEPVKKIIDSKKQVGVFEVFMLISNNPQICSQKTILAFEEGGKAMVCYTDGGKTVVEGINLMTQKKNQKKKTSKPLRFLVHSLKTRPEAPSRPPKGGIFIFSKKCYSFFVQYYIELYRPYRHF